MRTLMIGAVLLATVVTSASAASIKQRVLQLNDLPSGFSVSKTGVRTNAAAAANNVTVKMLVGWGRLTGWETDFEREVSLSSLVKGPIAVNAFVSEYRTAKGAGESFRSPQAELPKAWKRLSIGAALGHESRMYRFRINMKEADGTAYVVLWRYGRFTAGVIVGGLAGGVDPDDALGLARKQQARMAA